MPASPSCRRGTPVIGVEYKINFLRAITTDKAYAVAKVIKRGKQLLVMDVEAFNEGSDKVAAKMIFTGTPTQANAPHHPPGERTGQGLSDPAGFA